MLTIANLRIDFVSSSNNYSDNVQVEAEMLSLFRRITAPLRRQARLQRRVSTDKLEAEVAAVRAQLERRDGDMRRTLTDLISSTAEIAQVRSSSHRPHNLPCPLQEQNHMIEGVSTGVAALQQMVGDHRAEVSRFVSSAGPVLDKVDTWVEDWQVTKDRYVDMPRYA